LSLGGAVAIRLHTAQLRWPRAAYWLGGAAFGAAMIAAVPQFLPPLYATYGGGARPRVVVMTSLPIVWGGGSMADVLGGRAPPAPAFTALEAALDLRVRDAVPMELAAGTTLLLLHPYALAPRDLVAIDAHVRRGDRALILADGLSSWEPPFGIGDPRNPPVTSLLTPLFDHWGVELAAPAGDSATINRVADGDALIELATAGRFTRVPPGCVPFADGAGLRCRIGQGRVTLLGDADMLAAARWRGGSGTAAYRTRSDNIDWLVAEVRRLSDMPPATTPIFRPVRW
jgi:hypothetical protein